MKNKPNYFSKALALHRARKIPDAIKFYQRSLQDNGRCTDTLTNLGAALKEINKYDAALACYKKSLAIAPDRASTWTNLGNLYCSMQLFDAALEAHENAIKLTPDSSGHLFNKALVYFYSNKLDEATEHFDNILCKSPNNAQAHWHKALSLLGKGDLNNGFKEYEWRFKIDSSPGKFAGNNIWNGQTLSDKSISITSEQGFGDILQFARFIKPFRKRYNPAKVILKTRSELVDILGSLNDVDKIIDNKTNNISSDFSFPLLSLPNILDITIDNIGQNVPYINIDKSTPNSAIKTSSSYKKVGLIWAGKTTPKDRSCKLNDLMPLLSNPNAEFYSFQIDDRKKDIEDIGASGLITDLGEEINNFADTASRMKQMDLLITVDSGPAHLAGALGLNTWVLLLYCSDWRWLLDRNDSPWYPSLKLYRQSKPNCWNNAISKLTEDFNQWVDV